jgi:hypothetical protein
LDERDDRTERARAILQGREQAVRDAASAKQTLCRWRPPARVVIGQLAVGPAAQRAKLAAASGAALLLFAWMTMLALTSPNAPDAPAPVSLFLVSAMVTIGKVLLQAGLVVLLFTGRVEGR